MSLQSRLKARHLLFMWIFHRLHRKQWPKAQWQSHNNSTYTWEYPLSPSTAHKATANVSNGGQLNTTTKKTQAFQPFLRHTIIFCTTEIKLWFPVIYHFNNYSNDDNIGNNPTWRRTINNRPLIKHSTRGRWFKIFFRWEAMSWRPFSQKHWSVQLLWCVNLILTLIAPHAKN